MPRRLLTEEEYLLIERAAPYKSEYLDGQMYPTESAGLEYNPNLVSPMHPMPRRLFTEEEYLLIERAAPYKSEYLDGEMYAMAGAGLVHGLIVANISGSLHGQFRGRPCKQITNDLRVRVAESGFYAYPDVVAFCGNAQMHDHRSDILLNPQLIVEVISPSTADYDRGEKADRYRQLESMSDYILVEQHKMLIQHWSRQDGRRWIVTDYDKPSDRVRSEALAVELGLAEVYEGIVFPPQIVEPPR